MHSIHLENKKYTLNQNIKNIQILLICRLQDINKSSFGCYEK